MDFQKRIAILFHERDRHYTLSRYVVHQLADIWRADGHEVNYLFGPKRYVPADIILVHVNLSVVPEDYLEFAARYPIALNGGVRNIRKTKISDNLVQENDSWDGPVIVKSDLNCAGGPELLMRRSWLERKSWRLQQLRRAFDRLGGDPFRFVADGDYRIFDRLGVVPEELRQSENVVVERFRPEIQDGEYSTRIFQFLGDRSLCQRTFSKDPIVKGGPGVRTELAEPHAEVIACREKYDLDYGKLDYVINDGEFVLLDVNKTTGATFKAATPEIVAWRQSQAEGLYSYFSQVPLN